MPFVTKETMADLHFEKLQIFKDLPGQSGQHGVPGQVSGGENETQR